MKIVNKSVAITREEERDGSLEFSLEDRNGKTHKVRLWTGTAIQNLPEPEWLIRGFVQKGGLTVVYAPPGAGKSLLMLDWAQRLESGTPWFGHDVTGAKVLYVMGEGQFGLKGRLMAWQKHHGEEALPPVRYHIEGVSFWTKEGQENPAADAIVAVAAALDVDVVFVDTMASTFGDGDENRQQDMNVYLKPLRLLKAMGVGVVIAHHGNKSSGKLRGSTVLAGEADTIVELKPTYSPDNPGEVQWATIINQKQKDYIPFEPFRMNLLSIPLGYDDEGFPVSGPVLEMASSSYAGVETSDGRRTNARNRSATIRDEIYAAIAAEPGCTWRSVLGAVKGKNTELAEIRNSMLYQGVIKYDNGYYIVEEK